MTDLTAVILGAGKGTRMRSELPKVLHPVAGTAMIVRALTSARDAGVDRVICVIGYGRELLEEALHPLGVETVFQAEQLGTGHAVACATPLLAGRQGDVLVLYGDMPLLSSDTIRALVRRRQELDAAAVVLTIELDNPPDFGRIIRDEAGAVRRIVEVKDCSPDELAIREVNVGAYCFDNARMLDALGMLGNDNAQGEYYLTDLVELMVDAGHVVDTVRTDSLEETLGVNDPHALQFAEKLDDIKYAEGLYELLDAALHFERQSSATT
jgi:bifunctional UDP-N-acetylglucosamine pyrophosphorylase / glucosamine-1-phosphate N-acetyltransferase